jgi:hypothetical protein
MVHGKNRIPYRIDRRLTGLAGPDYDATISFGLPLEPEDSQYGKSRLKGVAIWFIWIVMVALALLAIACQEHNVPEEMPVMPVQNADGSWTPEFTQVGDSTGATAGVARNEHIHGDIEYYPIPVYNSDDHSIQVGWMDSGGYWPLGEEKPRCSGCFSVTEEWGSGTYGIELTLDDGTTVTYEEERMSALATAIMAVTMFMVFVSFVLVGILVARKADEVALRVAGYVTAVVFALLAAIVPFLLFFTVYTYDSTVIVTESGDRVIISGWAEDERFRR